MWPLSMTEHMHIGVNILKKERKKDMKEEKKKKEEMKKERKEEMKEVGGVTRCTTNASRVSASFNRTNSLSALTRTWHMATTHAGK